MFQLLDINFDILKPASQAIDFTKDYETLEYTNNVDFDRKYLNNPNVITRCEQVLLAGLVKKLTKDILDRLIKYENLSYTPNTFQYFFSSPEYVETQRQEKIDRKHIYPLQELNQTYPNYLIGLNFNSLRVSCVKANFELNLNEWPNYNLYTKIFFQINGPISRRIV